MKILILDDDETRLVAFKRKLIGHDVTTVTTAQGAIEALKANQYGSVCLDHDLNGEVMSNSKEGTGFEVAKWMVNNPECKPKNIYIHSFNPAGSQNMKNILPEAILCPGLWMQK